MEMVKDVTQIREDISAKQNQVLLKEVDNKELKKLLEYYPPELRDNLSISEYNVKMLIRALEDPKTNMSIPKICDGDKCTMKCPLKSIAPIGSSCILEQIMIERSIVDYTEALGLDGMNRIEFDRVMELVEADILDRRTTAKIAKDGYEQMTVIAVTDAGKPIFKNEIAVSMQVKTYCKNRKDKIIKEFLKTPESRAKFKLYSKSDESKKSTDLMRRAIQDADFTEEK